MAVQAQIGGSGTLFVGEDKQFFLELLDAAGVPVDMGGMTIRFIVRLLDASNAVIFDKTASLVGVYAATRAANTQRAAVVLTDDEMTTVKARTYRYSWKRMDDTFETVLAYGPFVVEIATNH